MVSSSNFSPSAVPPYARGYERFPGKVGETVADSTPAWPRRNRAHPGAPNVILVLVDDMGFSDIGPFGSEIQTPVLDELAEHGALFTNYHTAPACSPARAAVLTGLNPHRAGYGFVAAADPGFPNLRMEIADDVCTLPEVLRQGGYATFAVGKWHLANDNQLHDAADRSSWPVQRGFDRYYGSMEGMNTFFHPNRIIADNSPVDPTQFSSDYYLTDDLTDRAVEMIKSLRASDQEKPFFLYFAHVAVHGPLGAKRTDLGKYRGKYRDGWDAIRQQRFARQKEAGLFPPYLQLPDRNQAGLDVEAWDDLSDEQKDRFARYMEVYAAMVDSIDQSLARILQTLEDLGDRDNTIVVFTSDNGGTQEGGPEGTRSYFGRFIHGLRLPADWESDCEVQPDLIGGPRTMVHYPRGWGMVSNTPFRYYKTWCHAGGIRVPFLISWPEGERQGLIVPGVRSQYQYATDILPTILALTGVAHPGTRNSVPAKTIDGVDFSGVLKNPSSASTHVEQYSEFGGNRGFYRAGWKIVAAHAPNAPVSDQEWELYHVESDPNELHNLVDSEPSLAAELAEAWKRAAWRNTVFPMLTGSPVAQARRRPEEEMLARPVRILPGTPTLERYRSAKLIQLRSFEIVIDAQHTIRDEGILVAHGDQGGGYVVYIQGNRMIFAYNEYGRLQVTQTASLDQGPLVASLLGTALDDFKWSFILNINGVSAAALSPVQMLLGAAPFSGIDVGRNSGGPIDWDLYQRRGSFPYTGKLRSVTYRPGEPAPYNPEAIAAAELEVATYYD